MVQQHEGPPEPPVLTVPSLARNSSMMFWFQSFARSAMRIS
ncbi:MAG: hypothetical protein ACJ714_01870 [Ornithinibacter sp.]